MCAITTGHRGNRRLASNRVRCEVVSHGGEDEVPFEELYARAGENLEAVPWALLAAHPALVSWLDRQPTPAGDTALVVGCGYGDDAEELCRHGYRVTAFDIAPTAIARCRRRFPGSNVEYRVADLFVLPGEWHTHFDLIVEIRTLQSLPPDQRAAATSAVAEMVRPGGRVWLRCLGRADEEPVGQRPWPVSRRELSGFGRAGLDELEFIERPLPAGRGRTFTIIYQRPPVPRRRS
jgi:SAM-dependent methyltransferase